MTMMTGWSAKVLTGVTLAALAGNANAAYFCQGPIDLVAVQATTSMIGFRSSSWTQDANGTFWLCQLGATYNGISSEACKALLTMLLTAKSTGQNVVWAFNDSLSCTTHPPDQALTGVYYMDVR